MIKKTVAEQNQNRTRTEPEPHHNQQHSISKKQENTTHHHRQQKTQTRKRETAHKSFRLILSHGYTSTLSTDATAISKQAIFLCDPFCSIILGSSLFDFNYIVFFGFSFQQDKNEFKSSFLFNTERAFDDDELY